ncbi:tRNA (adenosine(37)-N6)-threonylcarbamoyltransferase complex transferase subunit TsaD [Candidatus Woesearchaeota archaeon]|nr:tRNA (adenosine(37)-N6)-threonylcarbamoyltransferase complex transferase subunit TsaD [Candidatus Woesearchaeota archaeon]
MRYCLGIESTAHTFGAAVVTVDGEILSNEKEMFATLSGGMIPNEVADHHRKVKDRVIERALQQAGIDISVVDLVSYSHGPGLPPSLLVGMECAKELHDKYGLTVIGANHALAHLTIGSLVCKVVDPVYVYVSGVNTQVIALAGNRYRIFGETLDVGLGNALDKFGRAIGLGFPAGPEIENLAQEGSYVELPYVVKGMDVSFAGLVTKAQQLFSKGVSKEDLCYSMQEVCFAMLAEVTERAVAHTEKKDVLLIGGVAANKRLCTILDVMCTARKARFHAAPLKYAGDQAAMIAWQGVLNYLGGKRLETFEFYPHERIDEIDVVW